MMLTALNSTAFTQYAGKTPLNSRIVTLNSFQGPHEYCINVERWMLEQVQYDMEKYATNRFFPQGNKDV